MKRYLFIYRADREAFCDPDYGYVNQTELLEKEFPAGTTDLEVLEAARMHEVKDLLEGERTASERTAEPRAAPQHPDRPRPAALMPANLI